MMQRKLAILLFLLAFALCIPAFPVHAQTAAYHKTVNPAYLPVRVVIDFAFTTNLTQPAMSTTNQSAWKFESSSNPPSATEITFSTGDVDVFNFGFTAYYPASLNQVVSVEVFQGSQQAEGIDQVPFSGDTVSMTFTVVTNNEPHYPSATDLYNQAFANSPSKQDILAWQQVLSASLADMESQIHWMWVFFLVAAGLGLAILVILKLKRPSVEDS